MSLHDQCCAMLRLSVRFRKFRKFRFFSDFFRKVSKNSDIIRNYQKVFTSGLSPSLALGGLRLGGGRQDKR
jgi:hypothetical protein